MSGTPFMPLWVSDFVGDTLDLEAKEVGAYLLILMTMWGRDGYLPNDEKKLQRVARCGRDWPRVWAAIEHYFTVEGGKITQSRLMKELQKVASKREVNAQSGARGGGAKALKYKGQPLANATDSLQQPEPYPESKREIGKPISVIADIRHDACMVHFNAVAAQVGWPQVQKMTAPRKAALSQRIRDVGGPDAWCQAIDRAALSPLLTGQTGRGWKADFDWLAKPANFTKLMEGNYDPTSTQAGTASDQRRAGGSHDSMVAAFARVAHSKQFGSR